MARMLAPLNEANLTLDEPELMTRMLPFTPATAFGA